MPKPTERIKKTIKGIVDIVKNSIEREREREQDDSPPQNSPKHKNSLLVKGKKYRDKKEIIDELQSEISDLENILEKKNQTIAHLIPQGDQKQKQIILLTQQLTEDQKKNRDLIEFINRLKRKLAKVSQRKEKLINAKQLHTQRINNLTTKLVQAEQERNKLQNLQRRQDSGY